METEITTVAGKTYILILHEYKQGIRHIECCIDATEKDKPETLRHYIVDVMLPSPSGERSDIFEMLPQLEDTSPEGIKAYALERVKEQLAQRTVGWMPHPNVNKTEVYTYGL